MARPRRSGDPPSRPQAKQPGLAKARRVGVVTRRVLELAMVREGWWSSMLDRADIVSEGGSVSEPEGEVYYGSTSLRCAVDAAVVSSSPQELSSPEALLAALLTDAHARLRMLRLAHREAVVRAGGPIHVLYAEIAGRVIHGVDRATLAIDVDVSARVAARGQGAVGTR